MGSPTPGKCSRFYAPLSGLLLKDSLASRKSERERKWDGILPRTWYTSFPLKHPLRYIISASFLLREETAGRWCCLNPIRPHGYWAEIRIWGPPCTASSPGPCSDAWYLHYTHAWGPMATKLINQVDQMISSFDELTDLFNQLTSLI